MISKVRRLYLERKEGFLFLSIVANAAAIAGMGLSYLYNIVMARSLSLAEFGLLGVAVAAVTIMTIPVGSLQVVLTREFARLEKSGKEAEMAFLAKNYARKAFAYSGVLTVLVVLWAVLASRPEIAIAVIAVPLTYATYCLYPVFQAREQITLLSAFGLAGNLLKLGFGLLVAYFGLGLAGAAAAFSVPGLLLVACLLAVLGKFLSKARKHELDLRSAFGLTTAILLMQGLFLYADLFAVQNILGNEKAGLYNVAETTAKITFYLSGAVILVLLPKAAKLDFSRQKREALALLAGAGAFLLPPALLLMAFSKPIVLFFYGEKFAQAIPAFYGLAAGFLVYSLFNVVQYALLARGREKAVLAINAAGLALHLFLLWNFVPSQGLVGAGTAVIISSACLLATGVAVLSSQLRTKQKQ
jgi:O-antigen/teichoic acid export membrane protein